jgi:hypothetical protein
MQDPCDHPCVTPENGIDKVARELGRSACQKRETVTTVTQVTTALSLSG